MPPILLNFGGMAVSAKRVDEKLLKLRGETRKERMLVYLPIELHKEFKEICQRKNFSLTEVVEELVREYVESAKKK